MVGLGSGVGVEGAAAGVCADASAGACCAKLGKLTAKIRINVKRPPHRFFKVMLLSNVAFYSSEASSLRRKIYAARGRKTNAKFR
jgi:hypothetical protein